jgi:hypothetical protein
MRTAVAVRYERELEAQMGWAVLGTAAPGG